MSQAKRSRSSTLTGGPTVSTNSRLAQLTGQRAAGQVSWGQAEAQTLLTTIHGVTEAGGLISFSKTSDGGALCLYVKDGVDEDKSYFPTRDMMLAFIAQLGKVYMD